MEVDGRGRAGRERPHVIVWTLFLAGLGFGLLVAALLTGSVIWAWACIAACVGGAVVLLVGALRRRIGAQPTAGHRQDRPEPPARHGGRHGPRPAASRQAAYPAEPSGRDWDQGTDLIRPPMHKEFHRPDRMDDNWR